ncbi:hypothetical protein ACJ72_05600 [Emergomyces africanus]|uniref:L-xylo-3-hexulose reductase n=1 Tax=Emergomyces africanus TaxID=1955775 RepID=A0A1B7NTZ6_9EURO|nr:hypothetical protein ACJ72_05600 [Emergomyces africanus]
MPVAGLRSLEGKFDIITGGSRGIGAAIAQNLASKGCSLLLNYISTFSTERTLQLCEELTTISASPPQQSSKFSREPEITSPILPPTVTIDILINNAGIGGNIRLNDPVRGHINADFFQRIYTVNVLAPLLLTQVVAPYLPLDRSGRIVNLSSVSSSLGLESQSIYGGTKAAIEAMTRTWARELRDCATVNAINPGPCC